MTLLRACPSLSNGSCLLCVSLAGTHLYLCPHWFSTCQPPELGAKTIPFLVSHLISTLVLSGFALLGGFCAWLIQFSEHCTKGVRN